MKSVGWLVTHLYQLSTLMIVLIVFEKEDEEKDIFRHFFFLSEITSQCVILFYFI